MDADCSEGLQCVPLNPFCQDCDDKYCVQTSCNDPDKSFHGRVIKSRFICDRMYGMPKEKDPFLDVACSLNPQDGSMVTKTSYPLNYSLIVSYKCTDLSDMDVPKSENSNRSMSKTMQNVSRLC